MLSAGGGYHRERGAVQNPIRVGGYILPVENLCKPLYRGHIAGFGGTGASGAALADLFLPTIFETETHPTVEESRRSANGK
jgi:hypothetical protein